MAPTIEKAISELDVLVNDKKDKEKEQEKEIELAQEISEFNNFKKEIFNHMEEIYTSIQHNYGTHEELLREIFLEVTERNEGFIGGDLKLANLEIIKAKKGLTKEKTCYLGFMTKYSTFKERFPSMCAKFSIKEEGPNFSEQWNYIGNKWDPTRGEIQFIENEEDSEKDNVMLGIEFDERSNLGHSILTTNRHKDVFEEKR